MLFRWFTLTFGTSHGVFYPLQYVGTFSVPGTDQGVRSEFVRRQLNNMKVIVRARGVLVIISPAGIKVTDNKGQVRNKFPCNFCCQTWLSNAFEVIDIRAIALFYFDLLTSQFKSA